MKIRFMAPECSPVAQGGITTCADISPVSSYEREIKKCLRMSGEILSGRTRPMGLWAPDFDVPALIKGRRLVYDNGGAQMWR